MAAMLQEQVFTTKELFLEIVSYNDGLEFCATASLNQNMRHFFRSHAKVAWGHLLLTKWPVLRQVLEHEHQHEDQDLKQLYMRRWLCGYKNKADSPKTDKTEKARLREKYKDCFLEIKVYSTGRNNFSHTFLVPMAEQPFSKFLRNGAKFSFEAQAGCLSYELDDWRTEVTLLDLTRGMIGEVVSHADYTTFDDQGDEFWSELGGQWPEPPRSQKNTYSLLEPSIFRWGGQPTTVELFVEMEVTEGKQKKNGKTSVKMVVRLEVDVNDGERFKDCLMFWKAVEWKIDGIVFE